MANKDIPIDSGSDFTADVVKAVEAIAQNVKNSATAFTANFDKVSNSIKTMQKAVVTSVKQIKLVAPVNKKDVKKDEPKDLTSEFSRVVEAIQNIKLVPIVEKQNKKEVEKKTGKEPKLIKGKDPKEVKEKESKDYSKEISSGFKSVVSSVTSSAKQIVSAISKIKLGKESKETKKETKESKKESKESKKETKKETKTKDYSKEISSGFKSVTVSVKDMTKEIVDSISKIKLNVGKPEKTKIEKKKETEGKQDFKDDIISGFESVVSSVYEASILITNAVFEIGMEIVSSISKSQQEQKEKEPKENKKEEPKEKKKEEPKEKKKKESKETKKETKESKLPKLTIVADLKKSFSSLVNKIPGASQITKGGLVGEKFSGLKNAGGFAGGMVGKLVGGKKGAAVGGSIGSTVGGAASSVASKAATGLGMALNSVTASVGIASGAIGMFASFIEKSNPALMEQFGIILNDLGGVIGRSLAPVIQSLLPLFRQFADYIDYAMKLIQPSIDIVITAFKDLAMPLMEAGASILQVFAPVLVFAAKIIEGLVIVVTPLIDAFVVLLEAVGEMFGIFFNGSSITKIMMNGFKLLADLVKILAGAFIWAAGAFYQVIGAAIKGIGALIDWIPGTGELGKTLMKMGEDADKAGAKLRQSGANMISSGLTGKEEAKKPSKIKKNASVGAAVRDAQEMSITGIGDDIRKAAMMAATGTKTQEESLAEIAKGLEKQNLADAVKAGVIAANADNKGGATIVGGNNPLRKIEKPFLAPV